MSAPPISSPRTNTWGMVGQPESVESSCLIAGSGRMSTAVSGAPARRRASSARIEFPHMANSGVPFMNRATGSPSITCLMRSANSVISASRRDSQLMDSAIRERLGERRVDELVLLDERQSLEAWARHGHVEVVAGAGAVANHDLRRARKGFAQQHLETLHRRLSLARPGQSLAVCGQVVGDHALRGK